MRANMLFVTLILASTTACAKDLSDWNNLKNTKKGTNIQVVTLSGERVDGEFASVSDIDLRLNASAVQTGGLAYGRTILRTEVREVYKVPAQYGRHMSGKTLLLSSLAGMAVGIGIGAAVDQAHPSAEDPGQGKLIGGVLGIFLGPAAAGVGRLILNAAHKPKLIYRTSPPNGASVTAPGDPIAARESAT